ncbi:LOW QUALITY PROTEIN: E3 ubiquitin-protein ligase RNF135-like [Carassius auratus]|uniref:LOW QUALITY PROTEIN: E3 ubiquitin-protein ligase RNF135-like n=1 Tax=Carassius auratus TaxID=7957 RepID=A0A6P6N201_CARAU|nr:LOW QUALITY PROTEIN: E3 ubiquitin-protein ligase RNF135-like [Carassius auratus]
MAEARLYVSREQFSCSICLEILNDPVTIPCGHSYCMDCIRRHWDENGLGRQYSCPQCRQTFTPRPVLGKNVVVAEMVEKLKRTELQPAPRPAQVSQTEAGPGDVECEVCTDRKYKAIKSCLVCLNSLCQSHFQQHEKVFKGERHCMIDATAQLEDMICPIHNELLEIFCHTDQMSICKRCTMDIHKNHDVTSGAGRMNQSSSSYLVPPEPFSFDVVSRSDHGRKSFAKRLKKKMDNFLNSEVMVVSGWVMCCKFPTDGPKNRNQILQYSHELSMDSNTINETLLLSGGNRVATNTGKVQLYPEHPDRFDCWPQVLCEESVCGRAYWEFEWTGRAGVGVSLAYKSICRKGNGDESKFGCNDHSINLYCSHSKYTFWESNKKTKLYVNISKLKTSRLAVYVDYSAGIVCFFSISDKMKLIYIVQTTFTQPIYPGFRVYCGSSVQLCDPAMNCT